MNKFFEIDAEDKRDLITEILNSAEDDSEFNLMFDGVITHLRMVCENGEDKEVYQKAIKKLLEVKQILK